jgi:hypothetical protein
VCAPHIACHVDWSSTSTECFCTPTPTQRPHLHSAKEAANIGPVQRVGTVVPRDALLLLEPADLPPLPRTAVALLVAAAAAAAAAARCAASAGPAAATRAGVCERHTHTDTHTHTHTHTQTRRNTAATNQNRPKLRRLQLC